MVRCSARGPGSRCRRAAVGASSGRASVTIATEAYAIEASRSATRRDRAKEHGGGRGRCGQDDRIRVERLRPACAVTAQLAGSRARPPRRQDVAHVRRWPRWR